jgi:hypothetical protein
MEQTALPDCPGGTPSAFPNAVSTEMISNTKWSSLRINPQARLRGKDRFTKRSRRWPERCRTREEKIRSSQSPSELSTLSDELFWTIGQVDNSRIELCIQSPMGQLR